MKKILLRLFGVKPKHKHDWEFEGAIGRHVLGRVDGKTITKYFRCRTCGGRKKITESL